LSQPGRKRYVATTLIAQVVPVSHGAVDLRQLCVGMATALLTLASGLLYERMAGHAFLVVAAFWLLPLLNRVSSVERVISRQSPRLHSSVPRLQRRRAIPCSEIYRHRSSVQ
jgi:hypothetical protein